MSESTQEHTNSVQISSKPMMYLCDRTDLTRNEKDSHTGAGI